MHWVEMLPDTQTPSWLGLPSNAEKVLLTTQGMPQSHLNHLQTKNTGSFFFNPEAFMVTQMSSLTISLHSSSSLTLTGCVNSPGWVLYPVWVEYCSRSKHGISFADLLFCFSSSY